MHMYIFEWAELVSNGWSSYASACDVNAQIGRGGEGAAVVLLGLEDDDVEFGSEEQDQSDHGAEGHADAERDGLRAAAEVDGHKGHPDDARRVHGETDEFGLVEVLRQVAGLDRVDGAHGDQEEVETQRRHQPPDGGVAHDHHPRPLRERLHGVGRFHDQHGHDQRRFDQHHHRRDQHLNIIHINYRCIIY